MRVDLTRSRRRPLLQGGGLRLLGLFIGLVPGPLLALSYAPAFYPSRLGDYLMRAMRGTGPWSRGEAELIATFVSNLNTCHF
jgi:hypothetical protein